MRKAVLIYNPASGRQLARQLLPAVADNLRRGGFEVEPLPTAGPADATRLARDAARAGVDVAFAMGGDGTLREVAAGLLGTEVALGLLPAGTANVMARALGLPGRAVAASKVLPELGVRQLDVGQAGGEIFLMCASAGIDAAVMSHQDSAAKRRFGAAAMVWPALREWWAYDYPEITLGFAGGTERVRHFAVCNIPFYGGPVKMAPEADLADGLLDLVFFRGRGRRKALGMFCDVALGRHLRRSDVELHRVEEVELLGPPGVYVQIDGDVPQLAPPLKIRVARDRLRVLAPALGVAPRPARAHVAPDLLAPEG